jgi:hypothetical protein
VAVGASQGTNIQTGEEAGVKLVSPQLVQVLAVVSMSCCTDSITGLQSNRSIPLLLSLTGVCEGQAPTAAV